MRENKTETAINILFKGGPRNDTTIRIVNPPPPKIRFGFPDWSTYEYRSGVFYYIGNIQ